MQTFLVNVYRKAALDVSTIKGWISRVNSNPRKIGETNRSERCRLAGQLLFGMRIKMMLSLQLTKESLQVNYDTA